MLDYMHVGKVACRQATVSQSYLVAGCFGNEIFPSQVVMVDQRGREILIVRPTKHLDISHTCIAEVSRVLGQSIRRQFYLRLDYWALDYRLLVRWM